MSKGKGCRCAYITDEYHGWGCTVSGGACMFLPPNAKLCAQIYDEGPEAEHGEMEVSGDDGD